MADSEYDQHNYGSGTFIGRDNYGSVRYELLDPSTRTTLAKLSKDAPELASILNKALRDGIISPYAVAALQSAVRNINEDVANSLELAGRNINEDVANSLEFAGRNINEKVAGAIQQAAETLAESVRGLDFTLPSLGQTVEQFNDAARRIELFVTPPPPELIFNRRATLKAFAWGALIGIILTTTIFIYCLAKF